ncbi:neuropeptide FF receptor 2-like [Oculina patagonica]
MSLYTDSETAQIGITTMLSIIVITNLLGNTAVCLVIVLNKDMRTPMNILLLNLAVADMMVGLFIAPRFIFIHLFKHPDGLAGKVFCELLTGGNLAWYGGVTSVFTLVVIAFERYYAVMYPYGNRGKLTYNKLKIIIPTLWISAAILVSPLFLTIYFDQDADFCIEHWPEQWLPKAYSTICFFFLGFIPVTVMTLLYSRVVYSLWFKKEDHDLENTRQGVMKVRKRVTKMVLAVSVIYGLCWMPNQFIYVFNYFLPSQNYGDVIYIVSIVLVSCNSTVNPFIYVFVNQNFRRKVRSLICCGMPCSSRVEVSTDSNNNTNDHTNTSTQPTREGVNCQGEPNQQANPLGLISVA